MGHTGQGGDLPYQGQAARGPGEAPAQPPMPVLVILMTSQARPILGCICLLWLASTTHNIFVAGGCFLHIIPPPEAAVMTPTVMVTRAVHKVGCKICPSWDLSPYAVPRCNTLQLLVLCTLMSLLHTLVYPSLPALQLKCGQHSSATLQCRVQSQPVGPAW